jgi:hypothetical protein
MDFLKYIQECMGDQLNILNQVKPDLQPGPKSSIMAKSCSRLLHSPKMMMMIISHLKKKKKIIIIH